MIQQPRNSRQFHSQQNQFQSLWKQIQDIDTKISQSTGTEKESAVKQREDLEAQLSAEGMSVVDSSDIEKVVNEWVK